MNKNKAVQIPYDLIRRLQLAQSVAVLTGAGISAESGVPTFREAQTGLWKRFRPEDLATPEAFQRDARLVWEWYAWRRELVSHAQPNPGHKALAEMERRYPIFTLITQNVDGLHQRAGSGLRFPIIELHGNIHRTKCSLENRLVQNLVKADGTLPRCPYCGSPLRPDIVWFGEAMPLEAFNTALEAAQESEVFFSIGTSGLVEPAASLPFKALGASKCVIEINPNTTPLSRQASYILRGPAGVVLPALMDAVWQNENDFILFGPSTHPTG